MISLNFEEWLELNEASFLPSDVPPYFYVAIKFTKDVLEPKPFTPHGAVATLVGLEGISDDPYIIQRFWNGLALKMPGRATVNVNRISRVLYDNTDYLSSRGLRTIRRLKAGASSRISQFDVIHGVVSNFITKLKSDPAVGSSWGVYYNPDIQLPDGSLLTARDIVNEIKNSPPRRIDRHGREEIKGKEVLRNIRTQKIRERHRPNHLKSIENVFDLMQRVLFVLKKRGLNISAVMQPVTLDGKQVPLAYKVMKEVVKSHGDYSTEKEWVLKRSALPMRDHAGNPVIKPSLNVPEGSTLYIGQIGSYDIPDWAKLEIDKHQSETGEIIPPENVLEFFVKKYKLYNLYNIYKVKAGDKAHQHAKGSEELIAYDPEKHELFDKIKDAVQNKGINRVGLFYRYAEKILKIPRAKVKSVLERWQKQGVISLDMNYKLYRVNRNQDKEIILQSTNESEILNYVKQEGLKNVKDTSDFGVYFVGKSGERYGIDVEGSIRWLSNEMPDEEVNMVFLIIRKSETGINLQQIETELGIGKEMVEKSINKLLEQKRIVQLPDGSYEEAISEEEMAKTNPAEEEALKYIQNNEDGVSEYDLKQHLNDKFNESESKLAIKKLKNKGLIFKSAFDSQYYVYDKSGDLSEIEQRFLDHLKDHPVSDILSLRHAFGMYSDSVNSVLAKLEKKNLVLKNPPTATSISDSNSDDKVYLNTKLVQPNENHHKMTRLQMIVLKILNDHFITYYKTLADLVNRQKGGSVPLTHDSVSEVLNSLQEMGVAVENNGRYMPANASDEDTIEEKLLFDLVNKKDIDSYEARKFVNDALSLNIPEAGIVRILEHLEKKGKLEITYDPINDTKIYHAKGKELDLKLDEYFDTIKDALAKHPKSLDDIYNLPNLSISYDGLKFVLKKMEQKGIIAKGLDFSDNEVYYLTGTKLKGQEDYHSEVLDVLKTHSPIVVYELISKVQEATGLSNNACYLLLEKMQEAGMVKSSYSNLLGSDMYHLPESGSIENFENSIIDQVDKIIHNSPMAVTQEVLLNELYKIVGSNYSIAMRIVNTMANQGKFKVSWAGTSETIVGTVYYTMPSQLIHVNESKMLEYLHNIGGKAKERDIRSNFEHRYTATYTGIENTLQALKTAGKVMDEMDKLNQKWWSLTSLQHNPIDALHS